MVIIKRYLKVRNFFVFMGLFFVAPFFGQKILPENLSPKVKLYWDSNNKRLHSVGCYYVDEINPNSTEKHGKWLFYSLDGTLEEERFFYRNRMHGKQTLFYPNKKIKQQFFCKFNVPDSLFYEYDEKGTLIRSGMYDLGSPEGQWKYFYGDSSLWKEEKVSNDTTYLISYFEADSLHKQTVNQGNGWVSTFYNSGQIKESYGFKNGLRHGHFAEYLASGIISISGSFWTGKKDSIWDFYFADGRLEKTFGYIKDSLHGSYLVLYENGVEQTRGEYNMGAKEGDWIWRREDGGIDMRGQFSKNAQQGPWEYYYSSGELSYTAHFEMGLKSGEWNYYYKDGTPFKKGNYLKNFKEGFWQTWYEDGTLLMDGNYHEGKEEGEWRNFWPNARIKNQSFFDDGQLNGAWYSFAQDGKLMIFGRYKKDLKAGKWTTYYSNGRIKEEIKYKIKKLKNASDDVVALGFKETRSVEHGRYKAYSQVDFTLKENGKFYNGKKSGKWINYYPGGVVPAVVATYKKGLLHGEFIQNDRMGNKMNEIHYKKGLKNGWFIVYGTNGKPTSQKMFRNGHEMRRIEKAPFTPD